MRLFGVSFYSKSKLKQYTTKIFSRAIEEDLYISSSIFLDEDISSANIIPRLEHINYIRNIDNRKRYRRFKITRMGVCSVPYLYDENINLIYPYASEFYNMALALRKQDISQIHSSSTIEIISYLESHTTNHKSMSSLEYNIWCLCCYIAIKYKSCYKNIVAELLPHSTDYKKKPQPSAIRYLILKRELSDPLPDLNKTNNSALSLDKNLQRDIKSSTYFTNKLIESSTTEENLEQVDYSIVPSSKKDLERYQAEQETKTELSTITQLKELLEFVENKNYKISIEGNFKITIEPDSKVVEPDIYLLSSSDEEEYNGYNREEDIFL